MVVQWQSFLCFAVIAASVAASLGAIVRESWRGVASRLADGGGWPQSGDGGAGSAPWKSCWVRVRPAWLLASRATAVAALAGVLVWDLRTYDASIMMYYTEWALLLEIAYFSVATLFSAYGCLMMRSGNRADDGQPEETEAAARLLGSNCADERGADRGGVGGAYVPHRLLQCFMQITYQVSAGAIILTDLVFWCVIIPFMSSTHLNLNAVMGCMHSFNLLFLLTETALNTLDFPWFRVAFFILWTCLYVIVQWIAHACGLAWWPYPFLSPTASWAPLWYLALALLHFPCYLVYWLIARVKVHLLPSHDDRWL